MFTDTQIHNLTRAALSDGGATVYTERIEAQPYHTLEHYVVGLGSLAAPGASLALRFSHLENNGPQLYDVIAYVAKVAERYGADTLGVWHDTETDLLWIDAGRVYYTRDVALDAALDANEVAIWDNGNNCEIRL